MKRPTANTSGIACGSIRADELLPLQEFLRRLKIGRKTWYSMKKNWASILFDWQTDIHSRT